MDKISRHDRFSGGLDCSPGEIPCSGPERFSSPDAWPAKPFPHAGGTGGGEPSALEGEILPKRATGATFSLLITKRVMIAFRGLMPGGSRPVRNAVAGSGGPVREASAPPKRASERRDGRRPVEKGGEEIPAFFIFPALVRVSTTIKWRSRHIMVVFCPPTLYGC